jgi:hypothetical protein
MRHTRTIMAGVAVLALASGCSHGEPVEPLQAAAGGKPSVVLTGEFDRWRHDAYEFVSMAVVGDTLDVQVRFGGGCRDHDFTLLVAPLFMESYPVQMRASLAHDAKGDLCRALVGRRLSFDLSPLSVLYRQSYGAQSGIIHINVDGWPRQVVYTF